MSSWKLKHHAFKNDIVLAISTFKIFIIFQEIIISAAFVYTYAIKSLWHVPWNIIKLKMKTN